MIDKLKICKWSAKLFLVLFVFSSCGEKNNLDRLSKKASKADIEKGRVLATQYCQSCHMLPDPSLLPSSVWENGVIPNMGRRLGIVNFKSRPYPPFKMDPDTEPGYYPNKPVMTDQQWQNIIDYYTASSPDSLIETPNTKSIIADISLFKADTVNRLSYKPAATSFVKISPPGHPNSIVISDAITKTTFLINKDIKVVDSIRSSGPIVDIDFKNNSMLLCNIGILNPNNGKHGKGEYYIKGKGVESFFDTLRRPVQMTSVDLNKDGKDDYIVCEFGFMNGAFSWMENMGKNKFQKHILKAVPGAIKAYITDYNHDGLPDIWVLFAQGDEGISLFTNNGNGKFTEEVVLRFPPMYGSSYFELADFNKDGYPDIIYTCGDNADYSRVLKPYHGVYIFMNDGKNHFSQKYFYHINGCYKAMARDFDGDDDLDIATISFFADYALHPEEGFVYFKNEGNLNFTPFSVPFTKTGRWLTMDVGELYGNGKLDIVLGNFSIGPSNTKSGNDWKKSPPFLVLKNMGK